MSNRKMKVARGGTLRQNSQNSRNKSAEKKQPELKLIRSYQRQVVWDVWLPVLPLKVTTTVTTGVIAQTYAISTAAIQAFATRFGATFVEYRMIKALIKIRFFSSTNPGVVQFWYDEKSGVTPTLAEAQERYILSENASSIDKRPILKWTAEDVLDLQYTQITAASPQPVTFKAFTNNANFGSSIVATDYFEIEGAIRFQFRGLLGV